MHKNSPLEERRVPKRWIRPLLLCSPFILMALAVACSRPAEQPAETAANNDPDQLLRQMSEKLAQAKTLSFKVDRKLDAALLEGRNIPENAQIEYTVGAFTTGHKYMAAGRSTSVSTSRLA